jgi:hypothetical protein
MSMTTVEPVALVAMTRATEAIEEARLQLRPVATMPAQRQYDEVLHLLQQAYWLLDEFIPRESEVATLDVPPSAGDVGLLWSFTSEFEVVADSFSAMVGKLRMRLSDLDEARHAAALA